MWLRDMRNEFVEEMEGKKILHFIAIMIGHAADFEPTKSRIWGEKYSFLHESEFSME